MKSKYYVTVRRQNYYSSDFNKYLGPINTMHYDFPQFNNMESAFSYNTDKKRIRKSKDEVDQTLFTIVIENVYIN
jgi:hypothetical protein